MKENTAFSLIEILVVIAIIATIAAIAVPVYKNYRDKATVVKGVVMLAGIRQGVQQFYASHGRMPNVDETIPTPSGNYVVFDALHDDTGYLVSTGLPPYIESILVAHNNNYPGNTGQFYARLIFSSSAFPNMDANNRRIHLAWRMVNGDLAFVCGRFSQGASTTSDFGFTDINLLPQGCNYDGTVNF
ncbi:MAG TPA: prepilin-type N-terminal cleavage/methylation domain-containing protein [Gammaproteobacteria bacterium]|nr:prepilin-type N-terminal cleavage/methylation domain-containing protein [Gammaproteobacteria bacterium]